MARRLRKGILEHMRTAKILTSLRIRAVCSESSLFAYTIQGPCWKFENIGLVAKILTRRVAVQTGLGLRYVYALRALLLAGGPYRTAWNPDRTLHVPILLSRSRKTQRGRLYCVARLSKSEITLGRHYWHVKMDKRPDNDFSPLNLILSRFLCYDNEIPRHLTIHINRNTRKYPLWHARISLDPITCTHFRRVVSGLAVLPYICQKFWTLCWRQKNGRIGCITLLVYGAAWDFYGSRSRTFFLFYRMHNISAVSINQSDIRSTLSVGTSTLWPWNLR